MTFLDVGIDVHGRTSGQTYTLCPQCSHERRKKNVHCLSVNLDEGIWKCHHCGWSGSLEAPTYRPVLRHATQPVYRKPASPPPGGVPEKILAWFAKRGIPQAVVERRQITYGPHYFGQLKREANAIGFPYFRNHELINVKYRDTEKHFTLEANAELLLYGVDDVEGDTVIIVEGECFPGDAQVLTDNGWCRFDAYKGGRVAQYTPEGMIEMVLPGARIQRPYAGQLVTHTNEQKFFACSTPKHQMVACDYKGRLRKHDAAQPLSQIDRIPRVGIMDGPGVPLTPMQLALCLAVSADASIRVGGDWRYGGTPYVVFGLKKKRKIDRLRMILAALGITASDTLIQGGYTSICFHLPAWCIHRKLPMAWLSQLSANQRKFLLEEMVHWDGNHVTNRHQTEYSTKEYDNALWMQTLAHTSGMVSTIIPRSNSLGSWFKVSILHRKTTTSWQAMKTQFTDYKDDVFCVQVPSGMLLIRQGECITVTGNCDAMALEVAGYRSVVSVPNGAPALNTQHYERQFAYLASAEALLKDLKKIVIAVDTDAPGLKLGEELARRLGPERCARVQWAGDCKDANEVLISDGSAIVKECVDNATPWPVSGIVTVDQLVPDLSYMYDHGMERGARTGWTTLDRHYTVRPGEWTLVTGVPSHGKSAFLDALMINLAKQHDWRFAVFSPENYPLKRYTARLLENVVGKPFDGAPHRMTREEMRHGAEWLHQHLSFLMPEDEDPSIDHLLDLARIQVYRHGIKGVILDPWNEIENGESTANLPETRQISQALSRIGRFAKRHEVHVWLIAHPTKLRKAEKGPYEGLYPPPSPYDVAGSAHFRNKPDACLCVWRDVEGLTYPENRAEVHIQKIKFKEIGTVGMVALTYDKECRRYYESTQEAHIWSA